MMTLKTHTVEKKNPKNNQVWEWEETPELLAAIEQLHKSSQAVENIGKVKKLHIGNVNNAPLKPRKKS